MATQRERRWQLESVGRSNDCCGGSSDQRKGDAGLVMAEKDGKGGAGLGSWDRRRHDLMQDQVSGLFNGDVEDRGGDRCSKGGRRSLELSFWVCDLRAGTAESMGSCEL